LNTCGSGIAGWLDVWRPSISAWSGSCRRPAGRRSERGSLDAPPTLSEGVVQEACRAAIGAGLVRSAHDISEGGVAVALAEACVSGPSPVGVEVALPDSAAAPHEVMFGEGPSRIVVSVSPDAERSFERLMAESGAPWRWIGQVGGDRLIIRSGGASPIDLALDRGAQAWRSGFAQYVS